MLASGSPRRRDLLAAVGLEFRVLVAGVDEDTEPGLEPERVATSLAERKALAVAREHAGAGRWFLGADTVVAVEAGGGTELLGKPRDAAEAERFLRLLSGSRHRVVTGVCVVGPEGTVADRERTWVRMRPLTDEEVSAYVASGEWRDKAGGYAIQENADAFVTGLEEGGFDNVVGLPVALALDLLERAGFAVGPSMREAAASGRVDRPPAGE